MISARLRYAALGLAAITFGGLALLYARADMWPASLVCLVLTGACAEACSWVRRAAEQLQAAHRQARRRALADMATGIEPWDSWCCELGWLTHNDPRVTAHYCTKEQL
ncbi:hypothetical protein ACFT7S_28325 [Streptomyces sp. NPDC057136]|uniref:hypothetical protein n=1 Tax=Streptomyces sp. NPDC057136 TaxID=3346029 RepID=UPI003629B16C